MLPPFPFQELQQWYQLSGRKNLPWRDYCYDKKTLGYRVWLAETMLQQTQVERVKQYFENILMAFPTVKDLADCSYEEFFPYYKWLWYYSRARNMLKAAQAVVVDFDWVFPESSRDLKTLAWVWPYTAEAIRAFAYDIPTLCFDTNLEKIFSRYYFGNKFQKLSTDEKEHILSEFQKSWISARDINNALMDYGATVSLNTVANIDWESYPLPSSQFFQTRGQREPVKQKKISSFPNKQAFVIAILHENHKVYFSKDTHAITQSWILSLTKEKGATDFSPFFIWKNSWNPRAMIQKYFLQNFELEVSVRPPELKSYTSQEIPYMICYCQIQSGIHNFAKFQGIKVRGFEEGYVEEMKDIHFSTK